MIPLPSLTEMNNFCINGSYLCHEKMSIRRTIYKSLKLDFIFYIDDVQSLRKVYPGENNSPFFGGNNICERESHT